MQGSVSVCSSDSRVRLRVISMSPSSEMRVTAAFERSLRRYSLNDRVTFSRLCGRSMSMKSTTIMPPIDRMRSCSATSRAASMLVLVIVSSRLDLPTKRPVLTSMAVSASISSTMR